MDSKTKTSTKDENSHVNHAFVCEEGRLNGGQDTRSATSNSSRGSARSSMKFLKTKLTTERKTRWIVLAAVALVALVLIIAVTLAVVLSTSDADEISLSNGTAGKTKGNNTSGTTLSTTSYVSTDSSFVSTTSDKDHVTDTTTYTTTIPVIEDKTTPSNLSVSFKDVLYNPTDTDYLSLICVGAHSGDWNSLTIRRQFKDSYEPVAVIRNTKEEIADVSNVHLFYPNMTFYKIVFNFEVTLSVTFEVFTCGDLTNFSCALDTNTEVVTTHAEVQIYMPEPLIFLPHSIIEDRIINISCSSEVWSSDGTLSWKIKPSGATDFMDFSVAPYVEEIQNNCSKTINSTLTLSPSMYENGSEFICVINTSWDNPQVIQEKVANTTFLVVPSNFCDDKREFTIHPHPYGACTMVVYCLNSGPLVYEIECEKGHCYDSKRTACIPQT